MAQSFYIRLITLVDDYGRFEAHPRLLRSLAFPLSEDLRTEQVLALMKELQKQQLAHFYKAGGKEYLQLTAWSERVRAETSRYPAPGNNCEQMFADVVKSCGILPPPSSPPPSPTTPPDTHTRAMGIAKKLNAEFKRAENAVWTYAEQTALCDVSRRADCEAELEELLRYRARSQQYFPRSIERLLTNWSETLDQARQPAVAANGHANHRDERRAREYQQEIKAKLL
jgi:hypothetical protein